MAPQWKEGLRSRHDSLATLIGFILPKPLCLEGCRYGLCALVVSKSPDHRLLPAMHGYRRFPSDFALCSYKFNSGGRRMESLRRLAALGLELAIGIGIW